MASMEGVVLTMIGTPSDENVSAVSNVERMTLRELQEEAITPLLVTTAFAGLVLLIVTPQFPLVLDRGLLGLAVAFMAVLAYQALGWGYLASAWLLWATWLGAAVSAHLLWPALPALSLLVMPVGFASLFIGARAGVASGAFASLVLLSDASLHVSLPAQSSGCIANLVGIWGIVLLTRLSSQPTSTAINWSWQSYAQARQQLELARDRQAELAQAVEDLANANLQMARLTQLLGAARRAAEEAERVKAEFVANVSHELRTPLNMIIGFADMIIEAPSTYGTRLPPALLADVAAIHRNSQHLASLINDVLDISQVEARRMSLSKEWVSLPEVVDTAALAVKPLFESRGLYLRTSLPDDLPPLYCDQTRIRQVLLNLLGNAGRFTETGGVSISAEVNGKSVVVTVTDTGSGIAVADLSKVFEPFRQLDGSLRRRQGGSGLGLDISRRFVELHGGQMGVRSQEGIGSSFWFTLPLSEPAGARDGPGRWLTAEWEPQRRSGLTPKPRLIPRVIVLESQNVLEDALRRYMDSVEVESATTTEQARALLSAGPAQVFLIRGESPEQTTAWTHELRDNPYGTPIVACSLPPSTQASQPGIAGYLTKPIVRDDLLTAVAGLEKPVRSVLLVDDDTEALQLFSRILSTSPAEYHVLQAASGAEALELMRARQPDLVLLDLVMPEMDGFAVLAEKNRDPSLADIRVLILSATDPQGQPIATPSLMATRAGGLSLPDLLRSALAISEILSVPRPVPAQERAARTDDSPV